MFPQETQDSLLCVCVFSEELDSLGIVHGDDLSPAVVLQRLQRAQQHPLLQAVEL